MSWKSRLSAQCAAFCASILVAGAALANPPGAVIANQAQLYYEPTPGTTIIVDSNTVEVVTAVEPSTSSVEFTRVVGTGVGDYQEPVGPAACLQGGNFVSLADPAVIGVGAIDPSVTQEVGSTSAYNTGEAAFIRLVDTDQNLDYLVIDTAVVTVTSQATGDTETIRLSETGLDTGVFAGYIPIRGGAGVSGDCLLQVAPNSTITVDYQDPNDATDIANDAALVDPTQRVFESRTGTDVDGASITLVDAVTGAPATVFGNDGISLFPSTIVSGSTVTDSSGTVYAFASGQYRFPVVPDGDYRLVVVPPSDYAAPSSASIAELQALPTAPFSLGPGSFGAAFNKSADLTFAIDIPVDPQATSLFLQKRTTTTTAAPGDFVRYELLLENASALGAVSNVQLFDQLPPGVRYVAGSTRVNDVEVADPIISPDLQSLEFTIATLGSGERASLTYVVEIVSGQRDDELTNRATALAGGGLLSNEASATIILTEDLFRSTGTIIGRIVEADCSQDTFAEDAGVSGIRVYLEDGRYAVSDDGGRFHFEGLTPGTHVAQLDTYTVPDWFDVVGCADTPGFAGRADSQFVKLSRGSLQRADFYLKRKPRPEGHVNLELKSAGTDSAEQVAYHLTMIGEGNVAVENIDTMFVLPAGVTYVPGTMAINGQAAEEPRIRDNFLAMSVDNQEGDWQADVSFIAQIDASVSGEQVTQAMATFDSPIADNHQTPVAETRMIREPGETKNEGYVLDLKFDVLSAELSPEDELELDLLIEDWQGVSNIQIGAIGHSDSSPISPNNRHLFADNYVLSQARAMAAAFYIADALSVPNENVQVQGRGPAEPVASNDTAAGRRANRRVEMVLSGVRPSKPSFLAVTQESSGTKITPTQGALPGEEQERGSSDFEIDLEAGTAKSQIEPNIDSLRPGVELLLPKRTFQPALPTTKISVQHAPDQTVKVYVNGEPISVYNFDTTVTNAANTVAVSRWKGVPLDDGDNEIRMVVSNADGSRARAIKRTIYYSGPAIRGEFVAEKSSMIADGKTPPVLAVRLFDRMGHESRAGTVGGFRINPPYRSMWDVENDRKNKLVDVGPREPTYRVGSDGITYIELEPTTQSGEVTLNLKFENNREQEIRAWLKPAEREWILVGFAEGTGAYDTISNNMSAALAAGHEDGYNDEGRVAFFAKGSIKGEYLMTIAYDSDRERKEARNRFETVVDPNQNYPLYADTSEQRFDAPSQRKLYVKLERNQFYALFGDYDTGLSVTDLARYERRMNGLKTEYRGDVLGYTAFAAEATQAFRRDEIRGDGTSGLYRLSVAPIIVNSETVRLEVRDRFDSGQVLSSTVMHRFLDYNLDTFNGTLFFKSPVPSRDLDFNPIYIVVEYETTTDAEDDIVAGGRVSARNADDSFEVGVTHVNDATTGAESDLTGVDIRWQVNDQTLVKAEYAETNRTGVGVEENGVAHSVTLEYNGEKSDLRAYIREVEEEFGLGYQSAADQGFRRVGVEGRTQINDHWYVEGEAQWQQGLQTEDIRNLAMARVRYERESFDATLGLTHAEDEFDDGEVRTSDLAELGVSKDLFDNKLTLRVSGATTISEDADNTDFPTRFVFGADYHLTKGIDIVGEYEEASGTGIDTSMTRLGIKASPWSRTQINTFLNNEYSEFGPRLFANVGLIQGFQLNERWTLDVGVDQTNTITDGTERQFDTDRDLVSGNLNDDFFAMYTGALYTADVWSANARLEHRNSDNEDRNTLLVGWYREPVVGHGLSAGLTVFQSDTGIADELTQADLKIGWAYRKADQKWSFLNRTDLIFEDASVAGDDLNSWRFINNFNANYRFSAAIQLSLQYASKYVRTEFDDDGFSGYTDLIGVDWRRALNDRWDIGVNTSIYHSWESDVIDYGFGVDVGYNLMDNLWLSVGYNVDGFQDGDFSQARYTAQGPYLRFSFKTDQHFLKQITGR
ncbi:MAG: OmpA family protein [Pseudomonadota bacterium]